MAILQLYLKGALFQEQSIQISPFNYEMDFEENVMIRELEVRQAAERLKVMYIKQIIKCQYEYQIILKVESKINARLHKIK